MRPHGAFYSYRRCTYFYLFRCGILTRCSDNEVYPHDDDLHPYDDDVHPHPKVELTTAYKHPGAHMVPTTTGPFRDFLRAYFDDLLSRRRVLAALPSE